MMKTPLQTFQFDGIPVSVIDQNGEGWMVGEDIGKALDYSEHRDSISKIYERNRDELEEYSTTVKLTAVDGKERETRVYNEEGVMMIGFFSKQPKAVTFRKWAVKVLKTYRHPALIPPTGPLTLAQFNAAQQTLTTAQKHLNNTQVIVSAADLLSLKGKKRKTKAIAPRKWTPDEDTAAQQMDAEGHGPTAIAKQLGDRTAQAVSKHLRYLAQKQGGAA